MINLEIYVSSLLTILVHVVSSIELSAEDCLQLGFRKSDLLCTKCDELSKFDLDSLKDSCSNCCQRDSASDEVKKYSSARLEVCGWKLGHFPQIQAFIKGDKSKQFPNFSVKYVRGAFPSIKLLDAEGEQEDELNIEKWDTNTVEEFLHEHLL